MANATYKVTLPDSRADVNQRNQAPILRASYRVCVLLDKELSDGAKVLYFLLDDYARDKGICWPKQRTLAERLGLTRSEVFRRVAELEARSHVRTVRWPRTLSYQMGWLGDVAERLHHWQLMHADVAKRLHHTESDAAEQSHHDVAKRLHALNLGTETIKSETQCRCGGGGWLSVPDPHDGTKTVRRQCGCTLAS